MALMKPMREQTSKNILRSISAILGCAWLVLITSCDAGNTQLVLTVDSDLQPITQLSAVEIRMIPADGPVLKSQFRLGGDQADNKTSFSLPLSAAVVPPGGDASAKVNLEIAALGPNGNNGGLTELFTRRVEVGFRKGASLLLPIYLSKNCPAPQGWDAICTDEQTCTENGCASPRVDVTQLTEIGPGQETRVTIKQAPAPGTDAGIVTPYGNLPPTTPQISLSADRVDTLTAVQVKIVTEATDPDNDPVTYRYEWQKNATPQTELATEQLAPQFTRKGESWTVLVYAHDGYQLSQEPASANVTIINTAPTVSVTQTSSVVRSSDTLRWEIETEDVDLEALTIQVAWSKNQMRTETTTLTLSQPGIAAASIAPEKLIRGDIWSAQITVFDSEESVSVETSSVSIKSARPIVRSARLGHSGAQPTTTSSITLTYEIEDKDADDRVTQTEIIWLIDGQPIGVFNETVLAPSFTHKHQSVTARIRVTDAYGATSLSVETPVLTIKNTLPILLSVDVFPADDPSNLNCQNQACTQAQDFECVYSTMFDADGDSVTARYSWFERTDSPTSVNQLNDLMLPFQRISGQQAERGKSLVCGVRPFDGESEGRVVYSPGFTLENQIPSFLDVQLNPRSPAEGDLIRATGFGWQDTDGDIERYRYEWFVDGVLLPDQTQPTLTSTSFDKDQSIQARLTPTDGFDDGLSRTSSAVVAINSQPTIGLIQFSPARPTTVQDIRAFARAPFDPDPADNALTYTFEWFIDGQSVSVVTATTVVETLLPASRTRRDQTVRLSVTPYDGEEFGPSTSQELTIANSPPQAPSIEIQPSAPLSEDDLTCIVVAPSFDADGDSVFYEYKWKEANSGRIIPSRFLPALLTQTDEIWTCEVTPADGTSAGAVAVVSETIRKESWTADAIHAVGGNTCIIRRLPQRGIQCWDDERLWDFQTGNFTDFIRSSSQICARSHPDIITCFSASTSTTSPATPQVTTTTIDSNWRSDQIVHSSVHGFCHWDASGTSAEIECKNDRQLFLLGGDNFQQVVGGHSFVCGLQTDGAVQCWGISDPIGNTYQKLVGGYSGIQAQNNDGTWTYVGSNIARLGYKFRPEVLHPVKYSISEYVSCALAQTGEASCISYFGQEYGVDAVPNVHFSDITAGTSHVCGITKAGEILCWGNRQAPRLSSPKLRDVAVGRDFACGLTFTGRLDCWGLAQVGHLPNAGGLFALGVGNIYTEVWAKHQDLCARRTSGVIDCWGTTFQPSTVSIAGGGPQIQWNSGASVLPHNWGRSGISVNCSPVSPSESYLCLSAGGVLNGSHTSVTHCELRSDGAIECWGRDNYGQATPPQNEASNPFIELQTQSYTNCARRQNGEILCWGRDNYGQATAPQNVANNPFIELQTKTYTNCARRQNGEILCWGYDYYGQATPPQNDASNPFIELKMQYSTNCARRQNGEILCWGQDDYGRATAPQNVASNPFIEMQMQSDTNCARRQDGEILCWGRDNYGQATPPQNVASNPFTELKMQSYTNCARRQNGEILCWGQDNYGQATAPQNVASNPFIEIQMQSSSNCARRQNGEILCWGRYTFDDPLNLPLENNHTVYAFGESHHCSLRPNGAPACKGDNQYGQSAPPGGFFEKLYARRGQSCGIRIGGILECWGRNDDLQSSPPPNLNYLDVGLAARHACGIVNNTGQNQNTFTSGQLTCWGYNGDGRGDLVAGLANRSDFVDVDCATDHCCALSTMGDLECFGINVPADIPAESGYTRLVYHDDGGCVLNALGEPSCWGSNNTNQLRLIMGGN